MSMNLERIDPEAVVFQAGSFSQALKIIDDEKKLDLVIVDLDMPDMPWEEGIEELRKKSNGARFVVVSASEDSKSIRRAMANGVSGYIPKRSDAKIMTGALKLVMDGGTYLPPSILGSDSARGETGEPKGKGKLLTNRQSQVLELVAQGLSNKQIAYEMGVSEATVKLHINALLRSIGATNRTQAVVTAQKMGLI
ncbi:MAG: response regulator transcription factor, partial [Lachnospiraceae bacterium]|nr:response regulator transcription factor [Lachnospiraceae bacterium]